ncbi:putative nepenthesin [Rosa chinensis]|uniref:Putative nepenthesin n=1 Tax=Rosa chinensis TaxID=74649 RepID=A0A2P6QTG6_ROSCH|nr:aspartyl protease family protein At5g10770 [Rosa chinensis]PRQ37429.1 putative nepenthesin [Rosa chinensis]
MATSISCTSSSFLIMRYFISLFVLLGLNLWSLDRGFALAEGTSKRHLLHPKNTHIVNLHSLLPANTCSPSTRGNKRKATLEVVHKHGPCSHLPQNKGTTMNHTQILEQDQARVNSINSRTSKKLNGVEDLSQSEATSLPAQLASSQGAGNYIVRVGLGTPTKQLSLEFDTGSYFTWTQCQPCAVSCYPQNDTIFDPASSTSYANVSCNNAKCVELGASTKYNSCLRGTCLYRMLYGDEYHNSYTIGLLAKDKLTLTSNDVFDGFLFGCGEENVRFIGPSAGLLGLSRNNFSIIEQTAQKYGRFFSYCLPPTASSTGYLSFGSPGRASSAAVRYTRLTTLSLSSSYYGLDVVGINVNGQKLSIPPSVFSSPGTIIDSGTVISRLGSTAYSALRDAFKAAMKSYPAAAPDELLDTCYDLSGYSTVTYPKIAFVFGGGVTLDLDETGIVYFLNGLKQVCLAFAGYDDDKHIAIFGNTQQKNMEVLYDVAGGRVGFAPGGC